MIQRLVLAGLALLLVGMYLSPEVTNAQATYTLKATPKTVQLGVTTTRRLRRCCASSRATRCRSRR